MTLNDIKSKVGVSKLELNTAKDSDGNATEWMRHWDNDNRVAISIHKDLVGELQADANITSLGLQTEIRTGEQGDYTAYRVVKYSPAETTL
jgi:hypothetical protein